LYRQVADNLRDAITAGDLRPGQLLPPEMSLAREAGVSVDVVRKALAVLRGEGLVDTSRGKGSRVRETPVPAIVRVPPGATITSRIPDEAERLRFEVGEGVPILVVERAGAVDVFPADRFVIETVSEASDK
jgi:DNA-binding FadR family transcriptional regulator